MNEVATRPAPSEQDVRRGVLNAWLKKKYPYDLELSSLDYKELEAISLGLSAVNTAARDNLNVETTRARRKRLYRKLDVAGMEDILQQLLHFTLMEYRNG